MNITNFILDKDLDQTQKEKESELCTRFRNVILGEDYFGDLYKKVKDITKFIDENHKEDNMIYIHYINSLKFHFFQ